MQETKHPSAGDGKGDFTSQAAEPSQQRLAGRSRDASQADASEPDTSPDASHADRAAAAAAAPRRVTLRHVAAEAGVSICTASKILSGKTGKTRFADHTKQRVLDAAAALQFIPSMVGRSLVGGRSMTIGLIVKGMGNHVAIQRLQQIIEAAQQRKVSTIVASISQRGDDSQYVLEHAAALLARGVDGLIIDRSMPLNAIARRNIEGLPVPVVYMGWGPARSARRIVFEREKAMDALATHLASLGHRQVAYFATRGHMDFPELKLKPVMRIFTRHGLKVHCDARWLVHEESMPVMDAADQAVRQFLQTNIPATALLMNNDEGALAAINTLRQTGLRVPDDISVIGFDDIPLARHCEPALATISDAGVNEAATAALNMLFILIENPEAAVEKQILSCTYIPRQSVAQAVSLSRLISMSPSKE